jgi:hypothetical protein
MWVRDCYHLNDLMDIMTLTIRYTFEARTKSVYPFGDAPSEADIMGCIRASPHSFLETRMLTTEPSRVVQQRPWGFNHFSDGGFEVRRKDWKVLLGALAEGGWNREWWEQRTVYIVRIFSV